MVSTAVVDPTIPSIVISEEDVKGEIEFCNSAIVCYVIGIKPPARIINGFVRCVWGKFGVDRVAKGKNGVFLVRFRSMEGKQSVMDVGPILHDNKLVIMKNWSPDFDKLNEEVKVVPTWVRFPGLALKH